MIWYLTNCLLRYQIYVKAKLELIENGNHTFNNDEKALNNAIDVSINFAKDILNI